MNIVYVDESVCHVRGSRFVLVGAFVASPEWFRQLEFEAQRFRGMVNAFRERTRTIHEFHAFHLFHGTRDFTGLDPMQVESALFSLLAVVRISKRPFIYSVVNTESLQAIPELSDVKPIDLAFRNCLLGVEAWVRNTEPNSTQLCVMDDTQNSRLKNQLKASYRLLRPTGTTFSFKRRLASFHDALYFGDSSDSIGLQVADLCCYMNFRHVRGEPTTLGMKHRPYDFFKEIELQSVCADPADEWKAWPEVFVPPPMPMPRT